jgi:23S rRNA-/tRNA-specific pseudouridylate synthase
MGHPILVDRQYAKRFSSKIAATKPLLHAHRLHFVYEGEEFWVQSPIPGSWAPFLSSCLPKRASS